MSSRRHVRHDFGAQFQEGLARKALGFSAIAHFRFQRSISSRDFASTKGRVNASISASLLALRIASSGQSL